MPRVGWTGSFVRAAPLLHHAAHVESRDLCLRGRLMRSLRRAHLPCHAIRRILNTFPPADTRARVWGSAGAIINSRDAPGPSAPPSSSPLRGQMAWLTGWGSSPTSRTARPRHRPALALHARLARRFGSTRLAGRPHWMQPPPTPLARPPEGCLSDPSGSWGCHTREEHSQQDLPRTLARHVVWTERL